MFYIQINQRITQNFYYFTTLLNLNFEEIKQFLLKVFDCKVM